jgi:HlyD family secretion protein
MKRDYATLKKSSKWIGVLLLSTVIVAGCSSKQEAGAADKTTVKEQIRTVKVDKITKQKIGEPPEQIGDVVSSIQLDVMTKSGGEVVDILKKRGEKVTKGDVLFRLDPTDVELQKEQSVLGVKSAQSQLTSKREDVVNGRSDLVNSLSKVQQAVKDAEKDYSKARNDYDQGLVSKEQVDKTETAWNNMKLDLDSAQKKLKSMDSTDSLAPLEVQVETAQLGIRSADRTLSNMEVKAPTTGVLTELTVELGMTVSPSFRAGQVQQVDPLKIKAVLTEASANLVRGKQQLSFYIPGATDKMTGNVSFLSEIMNAETKAYDLELEVPNTDGKIKPGSKAQILLTEDQDQVVLVVPILSIIREGSDNFVFILNGDTAQKRKVELGRINETTQEIISGVKVDEVLVVSGQQQLKDQEKVKVSN